VSVRTIRRARVHGRIAAPPSKSYTHRALVAGFLTGRVYTVTAPLNADDTRATLAALERLGTPVVRTRRSWTLHRRRGTPAAGRVTIDCGESGTTLRFATALAACDGREVRFRGRGRLAERPMGPLTDALTALGARVWPARGRVPFTVQGPIHGGRVRLDVGESSQFASALLLVLPTLREDSRVQLIGPIVSEPYMEATIELLRRSGITLRRRGRTIQVPGRQHIGGRRFAVPGDASSAAYLWAAGALTGGPVVVSGIDPSWPQADLAILPLLARVGAEVRTRGTSISVESGHFRPFTVDLTPSPDLYPLAGVIAARVPGRSRIRGAPHVIHKESNRRAETIRLVEELGARVREVDGGLEIHGRENLTPLRRTDFSDHRLVMSATVGALAANGTSQVGDATAVRKSFPEFWNALAALGASVSRS
jgi:3-phosphoshikimate 1-carboxyvinyltransferase